MGIRHIVGNCFGGVDNRSVATKASLRNTHDDFEVWTLDKDVVHGPDTDQIHTRERRKQTKVQLREGKSKVAPSVGRTNWAQEEALKTYLGKSASTNSIPRALSSSSLRKCCHTPERKTRDMIMMFDDDGKVVVKEHGISQSIHFISGSESSRTHSDNGYPDQALHTPDRSDGCNRVDDESDGLSVHDSPPADFQDSINIIEPALRRVFNPKSVEKMMDSCFRERAMCFDGHIVGRSLVKESRAIRRNLSWSHFSEISFNITQSSSDLCVPNRRHTVLVLTNEGDLEGDEDNVPCHLPDKDKESIIHRRLSSIYESHHVHLSKLQEQMGDSSNPPENLLELMARKMFSSHASLSQITMAEMEEQTSGSLSGVTRSHDLSICSDKLPKIKTRVL